MNEEKKRPEEPRGGKKSLALGKLFYHNTFVLVFSLLVAIISWFFMMATSSDRGVTVEDVPIQVRYSSAAQEEGLEVFHMSSETVNLQVTGNTLLTSQLTANDFEVSVTLNPTDTSVTGNTLQKMDVQVQAVKANTLTNFEIARVTPEEVTLEYDRFQEVNLPIESDIQCRSADGYYASTPILSADNVTISGPSSSVARIKRVAVSYNVESELKEDAQFSCPLVLYDEHNQEITNTAGLYLEMNVDKVDVTIPVTPVKTVNLTATTVHQPEGFSQDRIQIEPSTITIAGTANTLSGISEIQLDTVIDFADLEAGTTNTFTADIPLPSGVRNIASVGDSTTPAQATVTINLNGYSEMSVSVGASNMQITNPPAGMEAALATSSLVVTLVGPEAQVSRLTGENVAVTVDLANFQDRTGTVEVPATVTLTGSAASSCWATGEYTVSVNISQPSAVSTARMIARDPESSEEGDVAATPQK